MKRLIALNYDKLVEIMQKYKPQIKDIMIKYLDGIDFKKYLQNLPDYIDYLGVPFETMTQDEEFMDGFFNHVQSKLVDILSKEDMDEYFKYTPDYYIVSNNSKVGQFLMSCFDDLNYDQNKLINKCKKYCEELEKKTFERIKNK
jgi:predicted O-linked N-acetylglucosamine transferase (SPINDLY family)